MSYWKLLFPGLRCPLVTIGAVRSPWIKSRGLDLIVGCGAWSLPLLLIASPYTGNLQAWNVAFYALALLFNYPHYMATIFRAYHTKEDFARYRVWTVYVTALLAVALIAAHWSAWLAAWLFTIYVTWSPWHYMGQNFGLSMMFIRRNGIQIDKKDRDALWVAFVASYVMIFLTFHTNPSNDPYVLSLGLPSLLDLFRLPALAIFLVLGGWPLSKLVRQAGWRPMIGPITLYVTEFLWFVLPTVLELAMGIHPPQTRYSAGILAVMHSAQYLWITSYYARQESSENSWKPGKYFATLCIGGMALFIPGPWLASYVFHRDFGTSFLVFTALVNIHHFILDGAVWKLRDRRVASVLLETKHDESDAARTSWRWFSGLRWRYAGFAAVGLLLLLTAVDQVRYFMSTRSTESSLRLSVEMNPYDFQKQNALARILVDTKRYDEAYAHYRKMFARVEPDAASLMNFGVICRLLHRDEEAAHSFELALDKSPSYANVIHQLESIQ